jgi:hypothetical protein
MNTFWNSFLDKKAMLMFQKAHRAACRRAVKKHLPFEISLDDIIHQYVSQSGRCFYSNLEMNIIKNDKKDVLHDPYKMTLDCKDSGLGYTKDNIVWCIYCVNSFKQKMEKEELINICYNIMKHNEKN